MEVGKKSNDFDELVRYLAYGYHVLARATRDRSNQILATCGLGQFLTQIDNLTQTHEGGLESSFSNIDEFFTQLADKMNEFARNQIVHFLNGGYEKQEASTKLRTLLHGIFYRSVAIIIDREDAKIAHHGSSNRIDTDEDPVGAAYKQDSAHYKDCNSEQLISLVQQRVIPSLVRIWSEFVKAIPTWWFLSSPEHHWAKNLWSLLCEYFSTEERDVMIHCHLLLSICIRLYFPWTDEETIEETVFSNLDFDLRREPDLVYFLLDGLDMEGSEHSRKYALFICKQIFRFSSFRVETDPPPIISSPLIINNASAPPNAKSAHNQTVVDGQDQFDEDDSVRLFIWRSEQRTSWINVWSTFFLLYESMQQPQVHLVQPMLPLLQTFLESYDHSQPWLGIAWWESILKRAFTNDSVAVRKLVLEALLDLPVDQLPRLRNATEFLFGPMLQLLDNSYLYANIDVSLMISQFGERMAGFYARLIGSFQSVPERIACLGFYLNRVSTCVKSPNPAIFFLQALLFVDPIAAFADAELKILQDMAANRTIFHNRKARELVKWQLLQSLIRLGDTKRLTYQGLSTTLDILLEETTDFTIDSEGYLAVWNWLARNFDVNYLDQNLHLEISRYYSHHKEATFEELHVMSRRISTMAIFALKTPGSFVQCCKPAYENMSLMAQPETNTGSFIVASVMLFRRLDGAVKATTSGATDLVKSLGLRGKLFEWMAIVETTALRDVLAEMPPLIASTTTPLTLSELVERKRQIALRQSAEPEIADEQDQFENRSHIKEQTGPTSLPPNTPPLDFNCLMELIDCLQVFMEDAGQDQENLIKYLDILLYLSVAMLRHFSHLRTVQAAETLVMQLGKVVLLRIMAISFDQLSKFSHTDVAFLGSEEILELVNFELERPTDSCPNWNQIQISFIAAKWKCIGSIIKFLCRSRELNQIISVNDAFSISLEQLELSQHAAIISILACLRVLTEISTELSSEMVGQSVNIMLNLLSNHLDSPRWFDLYTESFIDYLFQPALLNRMDCVEPIREAFEYLLYRVGPKRRGLVTKLVDKLYSFWRTSEGQVSRDSCTDDIIQLLIFGPIRDFNEERLAETLTFKKTRLIPEVEKDKCESIEGELKNLSISTHPAKVNHRQPIEETNEELDLNSTQVNDVRSEEIAGYIEQDYLVRIYMNDLLNHLDPANPYDRAFGLLLSEKLLDRTLGKGIDKSEMKHVFPNAIIHRRKMRSWMTLLILFPLLYPEDPKQDPENHGAVLFIQKTSRIVWECIQKEALPSTRYYMEWYLILGYLRYPECTVDLLTRLEDFDQPASLAISIMTVIMHVGLKLPKIIGLGKKGIDEDGIGFLWRFYDRAFELVIPFILHHSHASRLHAIYVFNILWKTVTTQLESKKTVAPLYYRLASLIEKSEHCRKFVAKLDDEPMLALLDPIEDFDLQFIFCDFPKAVGLASNELITAMSFYSVNKIAGNVPFGKKERLKNLQYSFTPPNAGKAPSKLTTEDEESFSPLPIQTIFRDYQQKIALWNVSLSEMELGEYRRQRELERRKQVLGEIIVVASLIDKLPNLGGLCRTCEVLGATKLMLPSARIIENPDFRSLSMTSDKWLDLEALKPEHVSEWLARKKEQGYRILAIEQSAQSISLVDYMFSDKCVLVLGNEKEGVPAEILHLVDDCIEIPQFGMVRSLNVHVTGSIVLWEARRQRLIRSRTRIHGGS